jgi:rubrerythrin
MELTTFSMVLRYTSQLEDQTAQFYRNLAASNNLARAKELFTKFAESSDRRKKDLERTARESVDHSLLEPVAGIFEEAYTVNTSVSNGAGITDAISTAKTLEEKMQRFYTEAGDKIKFISNVSRLYKRYAQDRAKALTQLQDFS